ncbi:kynureninase [Thalassobacillus devorans]|uniref:Kynureninase n=1 Tax=Thalassobacillus devorans TaxID=279813 RepID=A0ABQ1PV30_9BACI|nr:kynureninase [Thalassobacillus devorans]NIK29513.1 kynureninase [Thalassobacillus devorans]GGD04125.1 kynureninase [Thalassobacillus devorans]
MKNSKLSRQHAIDKDQKDQLKRFKQEFHIKEGTLYMDGNSLGLLSKRAEKTLLTSLEDWKEHGIEGWTEGEQPWYYMSEKLGEMTAPLIGAKKEEVINTGSITTNLHQLLATFFNPDDKRNKILADTLNFPSDIYALKSQLRLHGLDPEIHLIQVTSEDGRTLNEEEIIEQMNEETALLLLPSVLYRSGQLLDMKKITEAAHAQGIIVGFDLAHSIGALPHELHDWGVDFAVWCTYKYLNSGPGGVGGLYVHEKHLGQAPGLAGWFSSRKDKQFDMDHTLTPSETAGAYQIGTPHILSSAPLLGSLEIFQEAGIDNIRKKSLDQTAFMMQLIEQELDGYDFEIANPRQAERRGGHVSLEHKEAARICKALKEKQVIPDFRAPNVIRLAPIALYVSYEDIYEMVMRLKEIMDKETYKKFENIRGIIA